MKRLALAALFAVTTPVLGHTALTGSEPASGSILTQPPERITLRFGEPTRLTSVILVTADGEATLTFEPLGASHEFQLPTPALSKGRNELRWRALSQDGHVVSGSLLLVLRPPTP